MHSRGGTIDQLAALETHVRKSKARERTISIVVLCAEANPTWYIARHMTGALTTAVKASTTKAPMRCQSHCGPPKATWTAERAMLSEARRVVERRKRKKGR